MIRIDNDGTPLAPEFASVLIEDIEFYHRAEIRKAAVARVVWESFRLALRHGQDRIEGRRRAVRVTA